MGHGRSAPGSGVGPSRLSQDWGLTQLMTKQRVQLLGSVSMVTGRTRVHTLPPWL